MIKAAVARTPILILILTFMAVGYTIAQNKVVVVPLTSSAGPTAFAVFAGGDQTESIGLEDEVVRLVSLTAPADGVVIVNYTVSANSAIGEFVFLRCSITAEATLDYDYLQIADGTQGAAVLAGTRGYNVSKGEQLNYNIVCNGFPDSALTIARDSNLTAIFTPNQS